MVIFCSQESVGELGQMVPEAKVVGEVIKQKGEDKIIIA